MIAADLAREQQTKPGIAPAKVLLSAPILLMTAAFFIGNLGLYSLSFWLPTLIANMGERDPLRIGLMAALPSLCGIVTMVLASRHADATGERRWHLAFVFLLSAAGLAASVIWVHDPLPGLIALCAAGAGLFSIAPLFWALPTAMLGGLAAAAGLAMINSLANLSGFVGPWMVGVLSDVTGSTDIAMLCLAGTLVVGAGLVLLIPSRLVEAPMLDHAPAGRRS